jgi:hypothetical protein
MFFSERLATMLPIEDVRLCVYLQAGVITSLALEPVVIVSTAAPLPVDPVGLIQTSITRK